MAGRSNFSSSVPSIITTTTANHHHQHHLPMGGPGTGLGPGLAPGQGLGPESTRSIDGNAQEQGLGPGQGLGQGSGMASGQGLGVEGSRSMSMEGEEDPYYQGTTHRLHTSYQHTTMHPINTQLHILLIHLTYPSYLYTRSSYLA